MTSVKTAIFEGWALFSRVWPFEFEIGAPCVGQLGEVSKFGGFRRQSLGVGQLGILAVDRVVGPSPLREMVRGVRVESIDTLGSSHAQVTR